MVESLHFGEQAPVPARMSTFNQAPLPAGRLAAPSPRPHQLDRPLFEAIVAEATELLQVVVIRV